MPGDTCDHTCPCPHMCKSCSKSEKSLVPTSLCTMQSHLTNVNFMYITFSWSSMKLLFSELSHFVFCIMLLWNRSCTIINFLHARYLNYWALYITHSVPHCSELSLMCKQVNMWFDALAHLFQGMDWSYSVIYKYNWTLTSWNARGNNNLFNSSGFGLIKVYILDFWFCFQMPPEHNGARGGHSSKI